jgi:hypothetical protein
MTSNPISESPTSSEEIGGTDETAPLDATGEEVVFYKGLGMLVIILVASDPSKRQISSDHFS